MHEILENEKQFYSDLDSVLSDLQSMDLETWFQAKLIPLMTMSHFNYFITYVALYRLSKNQLDYIAIIELLNEYSKRNADMRFISESCRFEDGNADLTNSILNILTSDSVAGGDVIKLHRLYTGPNKPSVSYLRAVDVIEPLMKQIFGSSRQSNLKAKILDLIAYASFWNDSPSCKQDITKGRNMLVELDKLLLRVTSMSQIQDCIMQFMEFVQEPVCASGILMWLKPKLFDDDFYEWTSFSLGETPPAFHILDEISHELYTHGDLVFDIWVSLLERDFDMMDPKLAPLVVVS